MCNRVTGFNVTQNRRELDNRTMSTLLAGRRLVIATRESRLALWQAHHVQALLRDRLGAEVELLGMTTRGDQILDRALSKVGGKGLFVKELETALEEKRADLAVHSLKDVPMDLPSGFALAAVLEREDPRDALVSPRFASLAELPQGAKVGTSSLRRVVQLLAQRPDLVIEPLRGNLDTRLRKLDERQYDAIVLASAGLVRLGIEVRADDSALREALATLIDRPVWLAVHAERAVSRGLGGSCSVPLAAHASWRGGTLQLNALLGSASAPTLPLQRAQAQGSAHHEAAAEALGAAAVASLRDQGAAAYLA
jgi:hydroxymethylbilane synthase